MTNKPTWRLDEWGKYIQEYCHLPCLRLDFNKCIGCKKFGSDRFEWGADAMHKASVDYLEGQCTDHLKQQAIFESLFNKISNPVFSRRYCPICYKKWKEGEKR